jgi:hypothetical protein
MAPSTVSTATQEISRLTRVNARNFFSKFHLFSYIQKHGSTPSILFLIGPLPFASERHNGRRPYHLQHKEHIHGQKSGRTQRNQKETRQNHEGKTGRKKVQKITPIIPS